MRRILFCPVLLYAFFEYVTCVSVLVATTTPQGRIIRGDEAKSGQFPWTAFVVCNNNKQRLTCTGSLIREDYVLTAAHCLYKMVACTVELGVVTNDLFRGKEASREAHRSRTDFFAHSCYRPRKSTYYRYDIALIKLKTAVNETAKKNIRVVSLPGEGDDSIEGLTTTSIGWGLVKPDERSDVLRFARMQVLPRNKCMKFFWLFEDPFLVCATATNAAQMVCKGDSGGPMVRGSGDEAVLVALAVFVLDKSKLCSNGKKPQGLLRVQPFLGWIRATMKTKSDRGADNDCETWKFKRKNSVCGFGRFEVARFCISAMIFDFVVFQYVLG